MVLADIDATGAESVADTSERRALATQCDVTRESDLEAAAALALERFGGLDIAVANAADCTAPDDIATLAVFLASDEARFISAGFSSVDGGASTRRYPDLPGAFARSADNTSP